MEEQTVPIKGQDSPPLVRSTSSILKFNKESSTFLILAETGPNIQASPSNQAAEFQRPPSKKFSSGNFTFVVSDEPLRRDSSVSSMLSMRTRPREPSEGGFGWYDTEEREDHSGHYSEGQHDQLTTLEAIALACDEKKQHEVMCEKCLLEMEQQQSNERDANGSSKKSQKSVLFESSNSNMMIGTKCFYKTRNTLASGKPQQDTRDSGGGPGGTQDAPPSRRVASGGTLQLLRQTRFDAEQVWYAVSIAGIRIVQTSAGQHAEYKVAVASGQQLVCCWKRHSDFKRAAEQHKHQQEMHQRRRPKGYLYMPKTKDAWVRLGEIKKTFRCLEIQYLLLKSTYLQDFLQALLFESPTEDLLMDFMEHRDGDS
eukprot:CAMPEP_0113945036 /NCGR_PEP_ID=MMETSP1339-20121228/38444_1 /TAXON_ID=94617 /ORGANISM="Fibrocapsa japonica" /LENGTH=368 /DNA_ID=CAMNT_0000950429 /DNA_START=136 /DNA_END=1242 /DNA_ORIENTATION=+ /assembly_acc=CAM_ASM_000762